MLRSESAQNKPNMSLREIARLAGVSVATASRVINDVDRHKVSEETRLRVQEIARQCGYRPNPQAVSLVTRRPPNTLGLVISYNSHVFESFYFTEVIRGAVDAANKAGMNLSLFVPSSDADPETFHDVLSPYMAVAGVLLVGTRVGDKALEQCRRSGKPFVAVSNSHTDEDVNAIDVDNVAGARDMMRHLLQLGHRRIAFIGGPPDSSDAQDRQEGYVSALHEAGIPVDERLMESGFFEEQGGREAMRRLLARPDPPTAVFAANDMMAVGALKVVKGRKLRVPEDISLGGFDDIPLAEHVEPALTTVHQPIYRVGRASAEALIARIAATGQDGASEEPAPVRQMLRTRLVVRESTGAPVP